MLALAIVGTLDTVLSHISPSYRPAIVTEILPSWWTWQVWWIALLIVVLIATLHTASRKIRELTPLDIGINLAFSETRPDYKQINGDEETYVVGVSARGGKIEDPEVFVHSLFENKPTPRIGIYIPRRRLTPTPSSMAIINAGITPTYFVNVFKHKAKQKEIKFCHLNYATEPISLTYGEWQLILRARGSNSTNEGHIRLLLRLDEQGNLDVSRKIGG
jgi:hypothetical protein